MKAPARYDELREKIDQSLMNIELALDEGRPHDDQLHWGHVGTLARVLDLLTEAEDALLPNRAHEGDQP